MSGRGKYRGNRRRNNQNESTAGSVQINESDSPVLASFKTIALKLNDRQDRYERLVKLSRDTTIESKRIIFLLHSAVNPESTAKAVKEARERLQKLTDGPIRSIGLELENCPAYLYSRAVTAGFQEFIEARTFCSLMESKNIITYAEIQKEFENAVKEEDSENTRMVVTFLPHTDYMLGLADLTGELMRRAINSVSSGDGQECYFACQVVRNLYTGYLGLYGMGKELVRKTTVTRNNVAKVEAALYTLRLRKGEAPPKLLLPVKTEWETPGYQSDDEGYY